MKFNHGTLPAAMLAAIAVVIVSTPGLRASSLSFVGPFGTIDQNYGDRITSTTMGSFQYGEAGEGFTPNVLSSYDAGGGAPTIWPSSYGDLSRVLYESSSVKTLRVLLTADPGYQVRLLGWDMATYNQALHPSGAVINGVKVLDANGSTLFSQSNVAVPSVGHLSFAGLPSTLHDTSLTLEIDARNVNTGLGPQDIGIDNVRFSQKLAQVPEPASATIMLVGVGTVIAAARRKREKSTSAI